MDFCKCEKLNEKGEFKLGKCKHKCCKSCLFKYIQDNLLELKLKVKCPVDTCEKYINDPNFREFISEFQEINLHKYNLKIVTKKCLTKMCANVFQLADNESNYNMHCEICGQPICFKCNKRHYPNECGQEKNESELDKIAKENIKKYKRKQLEEHESDIKVFSCIYDFECPICCGYKLPKEGLSLECCGSMCVSCLEESLEGKTKYYQFQCPNCGKHLHDLLIGRFADEEVRAKIQSDQLTLFSCKTADCPGEYHLGGRKEGTVICTECNAVNCVPCKIIHKKGENCEMYQNTDEYKMIKEMEKNGVRCYKCKKLIVKKGGCNAIPCDVCHVHTCFIFGIQTGPDGCKCTPEKTCHPDCLYGCIPDD